MNPRTRTILSEYNIKHNLYRDYCQLMTNLFEEMLIKGKHKHHINSRIKQIPSLCEKIERKKQSGIEYNHLQDIEDIAGIRIVFYTETDKKKFINSIKKEFKNSLYIQETNGKYGYSSVHIIASIGKERAELSEYRRYKDLKCEIQLTCMLDHAWSEVEHDLLYKTNVMVSKIDPKVYENLKTRMEAVMSQYIRRASSELENIAEEFKRIKTSKK